MELNYRKPKPVEAYGPPPDEPAGEPVTAPGVDSPDVVERSPGVDSPQQPKAHNHLFRLFLGLVVCFLFFYVCADYTSFTAGQIHPGELVFSNTMVQLWTATYRLAFIFGVSLALIGLAFQGLWQFFRPTPERDFDLITSIRFDLTPTQRIWLFFIVFFALCFLFVQLLSVRLPESVSVGP